MITEVKEVAPNHLPIGAIGVIIGGLLTLVVLILATRKTSVVINNQRGIAKFPWMSWGIVIIILLAILSTQLPDLNYYETDNVTLILAFVGVLTTFVVLSNHAQVVDIEARFKERVDVIKNEFGSHKRDVDEKFEKYKNELDGRIDKKVEDNINTTAKEADISKLELVGGFSIEMVQHLKLSREFSELWLHANIRALNSFYMLVNNFNKNEWKEHLDNTFSDIDAYLKRFDLSNINIPIENIDRMLDFLEEIKDRRKDTIYIFLIKLKERLQNSGKNAAS